MCAASSVQRRNVPRRQAAKALLISPEQQVEGKQESNKNPTPELYLLREPFEAPEYFGELQQFNAKKVSSKA
jgi:hypothetical protein